MQERRIFGELGNSIPSGVVDKKGAAVGDICISNGIDIWFISLANWQVYSGTEYQAIGVVVNRWYEISDGKVRVCSIPYMNCDTPDVGSMSNYYIHWNGRNITIDGGITETRNNATATADYNGKENTAAILAKATAQKNWRTDSSITNSDSSSTNKYFPAACCCWRFHTLGTKQGDWYLPAAGELCKDYPNKTTVDASLQALGMTNAHHGDYWSSTSHSSTNAWVVSWYNGYANY